MLILLFFRVGKKKYMVILLMRTAVRVFSVEKDSLHRKISSYGSQLTALQNHQGTFRNRNRDAQRSPGNSDLVGKIFLSRKNSGILNSGTEQNS